MLNKRFPDPSLNKQKVVDTVAQEMENQNLITLEKSIDNFREYLNDKEVSQKVTKHIEDFEALFKGLNN